MNSTTTLFSDPSTLSESRFYQNGTNNNSYLSSINHGLLLNILSYRNDNFPARLSVDYTTPNGITTPNIWYRFSHENGYTEWCRVWCSNRNRLGGSLDTNLIRSHTLHWTISNRSIYITSSGNLGVGTSTTQSKLAVNGTVTAKRVKVIQTGWPDYVFHKTYQLSNLSKIEKFIDPNHCQAGISSGWKFNSKDWISEKCRGNKCRELKS